MTLEDLKGGLASVRERLAELETEARKLENKNFADIAASAKGKVHQLTEHPDLERVHAEMDGNAGQEEMPFDPNASADIQGS